MVACSKRNHFYAHAAHVVESFKQSGLSLIVFLEGFNWVYTFRIRFFFPAGPLPPPPPPNLLLMGQKWSTATGGWRSHYIDHAFSRNKLCWQFSFTNSSYAFDLGQLVFRQLEMPYETSMCMVWVLKVNLSIKLLKQKAKAAGYLNIQYILYVFFMCYSAEF